MCKNMAKNKEGIGGFTVHDGIDSRLNDNLSSSMLPGDTLWDLCDLALGRQHGGRSWNAVPVRPWSMASEILLCTRRTKHQVS